MIKVLVACEESQAVTMAFRALGHEAYSCDIQACSGGHPEWHVMGDCLPLLAGCLDFVTQGGVKVCLKTEWDIIIAHPPCTYLSNLGSKHLFYGTERITRSNDVFRYMNEERVKKAILARDFFLRMLNAPCRRIAVENPVPTRLWQLPEPSQMIQPWMFGDEYKKKTYLWLKGLPPLMPSELSLPQARWVDGGHKGTDTMKVFGFRDAKTRSKTFPGIARAMADQWGAFVEEKEENE